MFQQEFYCNLCNFNRLERQLFKRDQDCGRLIPGHIPPTVNWQSFPCFHLPPTMTSCQESENISAKLTSMRKLNNFTIRKCNPFSPTFFNVLINQESHFNQNISVCVDEYDNDLILLAPLLWDESILHD